jgi:hypothetical protein
VQNGLSLLNLSFTLDSSIVPLYAATMSTTEQNQPPKATRRTPMQVRKENEAAEWAHWQAHFKQVSEKRAAKLSARQLKLAQRTEGTGGRPPVAEDVLRLHAVTVRLDTLKYRQLAAYAAASGRTLAATLRAAIDDIPQLTTEQHMLLRKLPELVNVAEQIKSKLTEQGHPEGVQFAQLVQRMDAMLTSFHH